MDQYMKQPWSAEQQIDQTLAQQLIETQFPALAPATIVFCGEGWDNIVYRVNSDYLFRFPRRQFGADCIPAEINLLPFLAKQLPLPIPNPIFFGAPTTDYQWPFLGYHYLDGQEACAAHLTMEERAQLAAPLAHFLKALHAIPVDQAEQLGIEHNRIGKLNIPLRWPQAQEHLQYIETHKLYAGCPTLFMLLEQLKDVRKNNLKTVVHGDLYARHLLVNSQRELTGIIDWGDLQTDHPASDLAIVFTFLPVSAHRVFFEIYGTVSQHTKQLILFNALRHTTAITVFAHAIDDKILLKEMLIALELIAQAADAN